MNRSDLQAAIVDAIQRECGYCQPNVGDIVMRAIENYLDTVTPAEEVSAAATP